MDEDKIKKLKETENELIMSLLKEAQEHGNGDNVNLLKELTNSENYNNVSNNQKNEVKKEIKSNKIEDDFKFEINNDNESLYEIDDFDIPHDLVPLPSKGLIYKNCKSKIPVAYLTASDEDLITSPNLYVNGKIIDLLLRKKILDKNINPDGLCKGDRDAIIVWLRATGYGSNFPVNVKDPTTGQSFECEVDLSKLKSKDFKLKPDLDGYFDFVLPKTKKTVKFKYLTHKDDVTYAKYLEKSNNIFKMNSVSSSLTSLKNIIDNEKNVDIELRNNLNKSLSYLNDLLIKIESSDDVNYLKNVTYLLEKSIVSIDGITDSDFIKKFVNNMPALDSMALRKYYNENEPGIDFRVSIERPGSLGGGSFDTFLELDSSIFVNIS